MGRKKKTLGQRIAKARADAGLTQVQLAKKMGFHGGGNSIISNWENDERVPSIDNLKLIAKKLKVSSDWLIGLAPQK